MVCFSYFVDVQQMASYVIHKGRECSQTSSLCARVFTRARPMVDAVFSFMILAYESLHISLHYA